MGGAVDFVGDVVGGVGDIFSKGVREVTRPLYQISDPLFGEETAKDIWGISQIGLPLVGGAMAAPYISGMFGGAPAMGAGAGAGAGIAPAAEGFAAMGAPSGGAGLWGTLADFGGGLLESGEEALGGATDWMGNLIGGLGDEGGMLGSIGSFAAEHPFVTGAGMLAGGQYLSGIEQQRAQEQALENWQQYGFPSKEAMSSAYSSGMADINQQAMAAQQRLDEIMSARGLSGGIATSEAQKIEAQRQALMAQLASQLTQFGQTPYSAPPVNVQQGGMGDVLGLLGGLNMFR